MGDKERYEAMVRSLQTRPLLILAYADSGHAARCGRFFRRHGWEVRLTRSVAEAARLAERFRPKALVVDVELGEFSYRAACPVIRLHGEETVRPWSEDSLPRSSGPEALADLVGEVASA